MLLIINFKLLSDSKQYLKLKLLCMCLSVPGPAQDMIMHVILPPPPPSQDAFNTGERSGSDNAPLPPPRGGMTSHSRSSSLDNQLIDFSESG